jgi:hypothetical protein
VTQCIRTESVRYVGTEEKAPNVFFANSDRPLSSRILDICIGSQRLTDNIMLCAISNKRGALTELASAIETNGGNLQE